MGAKSDEDPSAGTLVELLTGATHNLEEGTTVTFKEVVGMASLDDPSKSINTMSFKVAAVPNRHSFVIDCDSSKFSPYQRNGIAKAVKAKIQVEFKPLKDVLTSLDGTHFDQDLQYLDFCKLENFKWAAILYKLYGDDSGRNFNELVSEEAKKIEDYEEKERFTQLAKAFKHGFECSIGPLCAFVGGVVAQEIVKAITGKFMPIKQEMYLDIMELFDYKCLTQE